MRLPYNLFVCERCDLAGESEVAQQVASVWRDFDIENRVARKEIGKRRADLCFGCQNQKSGRIVADAGAGQQFRDLFRIFWKIDKFAQPIDGKFHFCLSVMSSEVETSLDYSVQRFLDSARNDKMGSCELAEKPQIVLREEADVGNVE